MGYQMRGLRAAILCLLAAPGLRRCMRGLALRFVVPLAMALAPGATVLAGQRRF